MSVDAIVGTIIIACALGAVALLVLRSRGIIDGIARRGYRSAREIFHDER